MSVYVWNDLEQHRPGAHLAIALCHHATLYCALNQIITFQSSLSQIPRSPTNQMSVTSCGDGYADDGYGCNSAWGDYGRWILTAAIIVALFFLFFLFAYVSLSIRWPEGVR